MTMVSNGYRDLRAWQEAMLLVHDVYAVIRVLGADERYALGAQMRRSVCSVVLNIAEGHSRPSVNPSRNDYRRFIGVALGSLGEVETQLLIVQQQDLANGDTTAAAIRRVSGVRTLLRGLCQSLSK